MNLTQLAIRFVLPKHGVIFTINRSFHLLFHTDWQNLSKKKRIYFQSPQTPNTGLGIPFHGVPFIILGEKVLWCHQGPDLNKASKQRRKERVIKENLSCTCCWSQNRGQLARYKEIVTLLYRHRHRNIHRYK